MPQKSLCPVIAIVGGGVTGAALAIHLARRYPVVGTVRMVVFEPREKLGAGLAYSTHEPAHRINVPAGKMTLYPDDPESFLRFATDRNILTEDADAFGSDGLPYLQRASFGDYVSSEIQPYLDQGVVEHRQTSVTGVGKSGTKWLLKAEDGSVLLADAVAIAVSHPAPALPAALAAFRNHPKLIADVTQPDALQPFEPDDRVLVIGNGLTSADVVATLNDKGHHGTIVSISRRGLRSRGHASTAQEAFGDFVSRPSVRASELVHRIRDKIRQAEKAGFSWHAVIDAIRAQGQKIWQALPTKERRRIVRLARPYWDVHRFRIAPQVEKVLDEAVAAGQLSIKAASLQGVTSEGSGFRVSLKEKVTGEVADYLFDAIAVTTGPAHGEVLHSIPFLAALQRDGLISSCATGLGIACDAASIAIDETGRAVPGLYIAGPLARGTFGELMGLPQVTDHAIFVAGQLSSYLNLDKQVQSLSSTG